MMLNITKLPSRYLSNDKVQKSIPNQHFWLLISVFISSDRLIHKSLKFCAHLGLKVFQKFYGQFSFNIFCPVPCIFVETDNFHIVWVGVGGGRLGGSNPRGYRGWRGYPTINIYQVKLVWYCSTINRFGPSLTD